MNMPCDGATRSAVTSTPPRSRTLRHPGRLRLERFRPLSGERGSHLRLTLASGSILFDALVGALSAAGLRGASMTILGGRFSEMFYCVAPPDPTGAAVIAYGPPIAIGPAYLVFGNATMGTSIAGKPLVHCHGTIRSADGSVRGGHILTERCVVDSPVTVLATAFEGLALRQQYDPETNISLLQPAAPEEEHVKASAR